MLAFLALDPPLLTFRRVWSTNTPSGNPFTSSREIVFAGGRLFFGGPRGEEGWNLGAARSSDGRILWQRTFALTNAVRFVAHGEDLLLVSLDEIWQIDVQTARTVSRTQTSPDGMGPFIVGNRLIAETTWGQIQSVDLRTHRVIWTLRYPVEIGGAQRTGLAWISDRYLWAIASDGKLIEISLDRGRVVFARNVAVGDLRGLVPLPDGCALIGSALAEKWSDLDGRTLWQRPGLIPGKPVFVAGANELWTIRPRDGRLLRYRAKDGAHVAGDVEAILRPNYRAKLLPYGRDLISPSADGLVVLNRKGTVVGRSPLFLPPDGSAVVGKDLIVSDDRSLARYRLQTPSPARRGGILFGLRELAIDKSLEGHEMGGLRPFFLERGIGVVIGTVDSASLSFDIDGDPIHDGRRLLDRR